MRHAHLIGWLPLVAALLLAANVPVPAAELTVFAAASLTDALKEIGAAHEKTSGDKVAFNFAASSMLARQIEEGAPADLFFSADEARMDALQAKGCILVDTRKNRLSNSLVVIVEKESSLKISAPADLAGASVGRIALADPKMVPAGVYARSYLEKAGLWPAVDPKVIPVENVRAALAAVESGNVDAGMVYKTDAALSRKVRVAFEIPRADGPEIRYPMAVVGETRNPKAAMALLRHFDSEAAAAVFEKYGFLVLRDTEARRP